VEYAHTKNREGMGMRRKNRGHISIALYYSKKIVAYEGFGILVLEPTTLLSSGKNIFH